MAKTPVLEMSRCVGCEACLELCPSVFRRSEAGYIEVADLPVYPEECVEDAVNCCPTDCISWNVSE